MPTRVRPGRSLAAQTSCADVRRFGRLNKTDEVFGTHRYGLAAARARHCQDVPAQSNRDSDHCPGRHSGSPCEHGPGAHAKYHDIREWCAGTPAMHFRCCTSSAWHRCGSYPGYICYASRIKSGSFPMKRAVLYLQAPSRDVVEAPAQMTRRGYGSKLFTIPICEQDATPHPALQHNQLMTERRVLGLKSALRLERRDGQGEEEEEERDHRR